ncbi:MAG: Mur ligase family protein [Candidatus Jorgensenbacteria bacterium]|nr:Mur ligase family protein [Candidatus Jorgensenbacteria bacterium]
MKKAYFIGICGAGMSAVANLLKSKGWQISGSDEGFYPPVSAYLTELGIPCVPYYSENNIPKDTDMIVIGRNAKLTPEDNKEVKAAFESGITVKSFPEVLSELTKETENMIIVGSYAKSTCTALAAWCLERALKDPSYFIGAVPKTPDSSSRLGKGRYFVLEGDEYPASNWDTSSKFLYYNPKHVLLTSLVHDHVNVFKTLESYLEPFSKLVKMIPREGKLIACVDGENVREFIDKNFPGAVTYGLKNSADWTAQDIQYGAQTFFNLVHNGKKIVSLKTGLLGKHNIENIIGVSALLLSENAVTTEELASGVETFQTLARRLDLKSEKTTLKIYEGFGSSFTKARAAIEAIKLHYPDKRLIIIFEPHTFSWRNSDYISQYDNVFEGADKVFIYKPPLQGAATHNQLTLGDIVNRVKKSGTKVTGFEDVKEGLKLIQNEWKADDAILILTSGDLDGLVELIPKSAEKQFPAIN